MIMSNLRGIVLAIGILALVAGALLRHWTIGLVGVGLIIGGALSPDL